MSTMWIFNFTNNHNMGYIVNIMTKNVNVNDVKKSELDGRG